MPSYRRVTIEDIARTIGVDESTVSRALHDSPLITKETKTRILEAVKKFGYHPNIIARSLVTKKTNLIGLVIPDIKNPFCSEIIENIEENANLWGYSLILSFTNNDLKKENDSILTLIERRVDGIIVNHPHSYTRIESISRLQKENFPFVLLGWIKGTRASFVMADLTKGAYLAISHLIGLGHKRIVFMAAGNDNDLLRMNGYTKALQEADIEFRQDLVVKSGEEIEGAYETVDEILKMKEKPTAIFAINDLLAIGIIDALEKKGLKVPEDFAVVGFDNIKLSSHERFSLTTIDYPMKELAELTMKVLLDQIEERFDGPQQFMVEPRLIVRRSSGGKLCERVV